MSACLCVHLVGKEGARRCAGACGARARGRRRTAPGGRSAGTPNRPAWRGRDGIASRSVKGGATPRRREVRRCCAHDICIVSTACGGKGGVSEGRGGGGARVRGSAHIGAVHSPSSVHERDDRCMRRSAWSAGGGRMGLCACGVPSRTYDLRRARRTVVSHVGQLDWEGLRSKCGTNCSDSPCERARTHRRKLRGQWARTRTLTLTEARTFRGASRCRGGPIRACVHRERRHATVSG